jgi:hypothetical protein
MIILRLSLVLIIAMALAACGGESATNPTPTAAPESATTAPQLEVTPEITDVPMEMTAEATDEPTASIELTETFAHEDSPITFNYPAGWIAEYDEQFRWITLGNSPEATDFMARGQRGVYSVTISLNTGSMLASSTLEELLRRSSTDIDDDTEITPLTLAGYDAVTAIFSGLGYAGKGYYIAVTPEGGEVAFISYFSFSNPREFDTYQPIELAILETIEYVPPTE